MLKATKQMDDILDGTVQLFWQQGYSGASMEELVKATRTSRYRFYEYFGSKRSLFLASLDHYNRYYFQPPLSVLQGEEAGLEELKMYFARRAMYACSDQGRQGCLIFNSMADPGAYDLDIALQLRSYRDPLVATFCRVLSHARKAGQVRKDIAPEILADQLYMLLHSMMSLCRLRGHEVMIERSVQGVFRMMEKNADAKLAEEIRRQLSALDRKRTAHV